MMMRGEGVEEVEKVGCGERDFGSWVEGFAFGIIGGEVT
jgi:hypothetical protein